MSRRVLQRLEREALDEVAALVRRLPDELRAAIADIPIVCEPYPSEALVDDGVDPDLLGLFVGDAYPEEGVHPYLRQIYLFLFNLWDEANGEPAAFREEVRKTLLHEIGHYLGLEESDLEARGLE